MGVGILDNDYQAAFDFMVLLWVLKVLKAKGLSQRVIDHLKNIYSNNYTIVVVNNVPGQKFENKRWSIRQGDRPSSILFCHGIDPHLLWLDNRLKGIDIYSQPVLGPAIQGEQFPITLTENFKVVGYIDDVKPAITSLSEFSLVDHGSSLFEKASGCILHRDPSSGKVKFLPLGGWRGHLHQNSIPVNYITISDHLDMIGVELRATYSQTRKFNGDKLVKSVQNITGMWKGGKFMPLVLRGCSINTYCLSKVWFRCGSVDLRMGDINKMTAAVKSWVYADQLIKSTELTLYRSRALAELIKSFLETSVHSSFKKSLNHQALFSWHVEEVRSIPDPGINPFYSTDFFEAVKWIKQDGIIDAKNLSIKCIYKSLLERFVIHEIDNAGFHFNIPLSVELKWPQRPWDRIWPLVSLKGLDSEDSSFLFRLVHNLLPCQERLIRVLKPMVEVPHCSFCSMNVVGDLFHELVSCSFNNDVGYWLIRCIRTISPNVSASNTLELDLGFDVTSENVFSTIWLIAKGFSLIWKMRAEKKTNNIHST